MNRDGLGRITRSDRRPVIWAYLVGVPGATAVEVARAGLGLHGTNGGVLYLLRRMERDGEVTSRQEYRASQGREVAVWFAVPGAFAIAEDVAVTA